MAFLEDFCNELRSLATEADVDGMRRFCEPLKFAAQTIEDLLADNDKIQRDLTDEYVAFNRAIELCCLMFRDIGADDGSFCELRDQGFLDGYKDGTLGTYNVSDRYKDRLLKLGGERAKRKLREWGIEVEDEL
jgi:hypothetical protein